MASTGMSWDAVLTELDLPRLQALNSYWRSHPPLHIMVAAHLGIKPQPQSHDQPIQPPSEKDMQELLETFPTAPPPVFMTTEEYKRKREETLTHE